MCSSAGVSEETVNSLPVDNNVEDMMGRSVDAGSLTMAVPLIVDDSICVGERMSYANDFCVTVKQCGWNEYGMMEFRKRCG